MLVVSLNNLKNQRQLYIFASITISEVGHKYALHFFLILCTKINSMHRLLFIVLNASEENENWQMLPGFQDNKNIIFLSLSEEHSWPSPLALSFSPMFILMEGGLPGAKGRCLPSSYISPSRILFLYLGPRIPCQNSTEPTSRPKMTFSLSPSS